MHTFRFQISITGRLYSERVYTAESRCCRSSIVLGQGIKRNGLCPLGLGSLSTWGVEIARVSKVDQVPDSPTLSRIVLVLDPDPHDITQVDIAIVYALARGIPQRVYDAEPYLSVMLQTQFQTEALAGYKLEVGGHEATGVPRVP